jgi:C4-dicarboxylate transporter DctM subunit
MDRDMIAAGGFALLFLLMLLRVPIGFAMGISGVAGFAAVTGFNWTVALNLLSSSPISTATQYSFALIPMFILMGAFATASGMSRELFGFANAWMGHRKGGVGMATIGACAGFAAICGSSVATAATFSKVAFPEMRRLGYSERLSSGVIAAGGTLGIIIPPSVPLALYGILTEQDVGRLFIAAIIPGILAAFMYMVTIRIIAAVSGEQMTTIDKPSWAERLRALRGVWAILLLFIFIFGGIYGGVFTATEAAAMGAMGALIIALLRRKMSRADFFEALRETVRTTAAIFTILIGALIFGYFLAITQVPQDLTNAIIDTGLNRYIILCILLFFFLLLGCVLDPIAMILLTVPIVFPLILELGFDPIWFGIIMVMTVELGLITPPVGMNVFVIKSVLRTVGLTTIFLGVAPFILTDVIRLGILIVFPELVTFLPERMN